MSDDAGKGLRLYNTLTRRKEPFVPADPRAVRMYVCGPTVYDYAHIGNARPAIVFDVLFRLLRHLYGEEHVIYARNITDVDDKINARAARDYPDLPLNEAIAKVTGPTESQYKADVKALGCLDPTHEPRATAHLDGMRAIIEKLIARGVAYVAENHVLFSPKAMEQVQGAPRYGSLARRSLDEMLAGARVDVAPYKRDPMDFVLWKPSDPGQPGWLSPAGLAGLGRPGWHIECSAMAMAKLLEPFGGGLQCDDPQKNIFDIHGGGIDLVFPHHENEIAQSCCAFGTDRMASVWMHNGFLQVEGEKMSKSAGNFFTINELMTTPVFGGRAWPGEVLRLAMLKTHYRQPIDFTVDRLIDCEVELALYRKTVRYAVPEKGTLLPQIIPTLADDLNTHSALQALRGKGVSDHDLAHSLVWLGVLDNSEFERGRGHQSQVRASVERAFLVVERNELAREKGIVPEAVDSLIAARNAARDSARDADRQAKNDPSLKDLARKFWAESDRIRDELAAMGIALKDGKDDAGNPVTTWEVTR